MNWINVKENSDFPKDRAFVVITKEDEVAYTVIYTSQENWQVFEPHCCNESFYTTPELIDYITHWLPLPELPK